MLSNVLWTTGVIGDSVLIFVLVIRGRWRKFPTFTILIASDLCFGLLTFLLSRHGQVLWYSRVYWTYFPFNIALQLALLLELARVVLRPTGTWVADARKQFILSGALGAAVAALLAYMVAPPAPTFRTALEVRANLFTSMLVCELFIAMTLASNRLGLFWKNHVMAIGQGLTAWSMVAVIVDALHSYLGASRLYDSLDYVRSLTYIGALGYWSARLWREEPALKPISPELRNYIVALHRQVQYDLGEAEQ